MSSSQTVEIPTQPTWYKATILKKRPMFHPEGILLKIDKIPTFPSVPVPKGKFDDLTGKDIEGDDYTYKVGQRVWVQFSGTATNLNVIKVTRMEEKDMHKDHPSSGAVAYA